jgi:hypothetical protein
MMKKLALLAAVSLVAAGFGGAAMAQGTDDAFQKADANHDTFVDLTEAQGVYSTLTQAQFDQADTNKDGKLDAAEFGSLQGLTATDQGNQTSSSSASSAAQ